MTTNLKRAWKFVSAPRFSYLDNLAIFVLAAVVLAWTR
jgi:hypothetical protein